MNFKDGPNGRMAAEWKTKIHPELRAVLTEFEFYSDSHDLPAPVITQLGRSRAEQVAIYASLWRKTLAALEPGPNHLRIDPENDGTFRAMSPSEVLQAQTLLTRLKGLILQAEALGEVTPAERAAIETEYLEDAATSRFTWHWAFCAADLRTKHYSREQGERVVGFFEARCKNPLWEFLVHDTAGPHAHIARKAPDWRARYSPLAPLAPLHVS